MGRIQIDMRTECLAQADNFMPISKKSTVFQVPGIGNVFVSVSYYFYIGDTYTTRTHSNRMSTVSLPIIGALCPGAKARVGRRGSLYREAVGLWLELGRGQVYIEV